MGLFFFEEILKFNYEIKNLVENDLSNRSQILLVNLYDSGFDLKIDSNDGFHPNPRGAKIFANAWFNVFKPVLDKESKCIKTLYFH